MGSTALGLAIGLIIALNLYAIDQHDKVPMQLALPCPEQTCNFSSLMPFMDHDTVNFIEFLWTTRLRNLDSNITEVYFCGDNFNVQFGHCNLNRYYCTIGILVGGLFFLAMYGCVSRITVLRVRANRAKVRLGTQEIKEDGGPEEPPGYAEKS